jgi:hypothetical protein
MGGRSAVPDRPLQVTYGFLPNEAMRSARWFEVSSSRFKVFRKLRNEANSPTPQPRNRIDFCETKPLGQIRGPKDRKPKKIRRPKSNHNGGNHSPLGVYNDFTKRSQLKTTKTLRTQRATAFTKRSHSESSCSSCLCGLLRNLPNEPILEERQDEHDGQDTGGEITKRTHGTD